MNRRLFVSVTIGMFIVCSMHQAFGNGMVGEKSVSLLSTTLNLVMVLDFGEDIPGDLISNTFGKAVIEEQIVLSTIPVANNLLNSYADSDKVIQDQCMEILKRLRGNSSKDILILLDQKVDPNYVLFIPKNKFPSGKATTQSLKALGLSENLYQISYRDYLDEYFEVEKLEKFNIAALKKILPFSSVRKRIFLIGHGASEEHKIGARIAELTPQELRELLVYFGTINIDIMGILSCYAGGLNLVNVYKEFDEIIKKYVNFKVSYPIFVASLTDTGVRWPKRTFKEFFQKVDAFFEGKTEYFSEAFNAMLNALQLDVSGHPSIRLPGTAFFSAIDLDEKVTLITYDKLQQYKKGKGSFFLGNPAFILPETDQALLLYPSVIDVPVVIEGRKAPALISMIGGNARHYLQQLDAKNLTFEELLNSISLSTPVIGVRFFFIDQLKVSSFSLAGLENNFKLLMPKGAEGALELKKGSTTLKNIAITSAGNAMIVLGEALMKVVDPKSKKEQLQILFIKAEFVDGELKEPVQITREEYIVGVLLGLKLGQPFDEMLAIATGGNESNQLIIDILRKSFGTKTAVGLNFNGLLEYIETVSNKSFNNTTGQEFKKAIETLHKSVETKTTEQEAVKTPITPSDGVSFEDVE